MSTTPATFRHAIGAAMSIALTSAKDLPAALKGLDAMYAKLADQASDRDRVVSEEVAVQLREHPELFASFNFASSLVSAPQSAFYSAVIDACRANLNTLTPEQLVMVCEKCRRNKMYEEMNRVSVTLEIKIASWDSKSADLLRSKVTYEEHMAAYIQALEATGDDATLLFKKSIALAELSAKQATNGGDEVGGLFALMNIGGLLMWRFGPWQEAIAHSTDVYTRAKELAVLAKSEKAMLRANRVAMSTLMHRMNITIKHNGPKAEVHDWLTELQANPVWLSAQTEPWALKPAEDALAYINS